MMQHLTLRQDIHINKYSIILFTRVMMLEFEEMCQEMSAVQKCDTLNKKEDEVKLVWILI